MFNSLTGVVTGKFPQKLFIETNGIEWDVTVPDTSLEKIPSVGSKGRVFVWMQHTENLMSLFGFATENERALFFDLLKVDGIGPKGAVGILSALSANDLRLAVLADDDKAIAKAPGIGPKTAKKLILELKDKFHLEDALEEIAAPVKMVSHGSEVNDAAMEAVQALTALGYSNSDALKAVRMADTKEMTNTEEILKAALKQLAFL